MPKIGLKKFARSRQQKQMTFSDADFLGVLRVKVSEYPGQISTISMQIPSLIKIHCYSLKLSSGNENTDVVRADNSVRN